MILFQETNAMEDMYCGEQNCYEGKLSYWLDHQLIKGQFR